MESCTMTTWNRLCRACLVTKETFSYYLFDQISPEVYWFCTSIEPNQEEGLPKCLCNNCYDLLVKFSEFKKTCIESQNKLLNLRDNVKTETGNIDLSNGSDLNNYYNDAIIKAESDSDHYNEDVLDPENFEETQVKEVKLHKRKLKRAQKLKQHKTKCETKLSSRKHFIFSCKLCNKKFNHSERFEAHKLEHEGKKVPIQCLPCNKTFVTWSGLRRHNESDHTLISLEKLTCATCGKICKSRQTLKMHEKIHGERKILVCDTCGKGFSTTVTLKTHQETHMENRERRYTCEHCGKKFYTKSILLSHFARRHTGRKFICQICNYPFTDKYNLSKHLLIHEGKKMYKCDVCHKSYATQSTLVEHKRIHSGERPFICSYCSKGFLSKRRLTDHHRIHTGEKPHKCGICEQRFTQRGTLKRHMKVHDKIIPMLE